MKCSLGIFNFLEGSLGYLVFFSSVAQLCPTLCNPMNHSKPGLPVHHQLPEFTQTPVHQVGLLQHHSSKASIFQCSAFVIVQLSHPYMTTGKAVALLDGTFVGKVISLLFNMLSRLVIAFLPRSKRLFISWLQSPSAVILEPQNKVCHCFHCFPIYLPSDEIRCHDHSFLNAEFQASFFTLLFHFHQEAL